jgi:WD40 repeat protein
LDARRRHELLQEMLLGARDLAPAERGAFLDAACGGDAGLRRDIERLLAHDARPAGAGPLDEVSGHALRVELEGLLRETRTPARADADLPDAIGPYRVLRKLGEGGMGVVYEAEQERPRRTVALKALRPGFLTPGALRRFEHETEFLGRLQHPGIAQIFGSGTAGCEDGPRPYFAMELVRGKPLTEHARDARLSAGARLELLARVADAVHHAHLYGVIHRDLKPANILVDATGQPKVLDFGVARASDSDVAPTTLSTNVGQILGTLAYMSPEQASGDPRVIDTRSDIYSLGVLLFELLTGELPYDVSSKLLPEAVRAIQEDEPRRLSSSHSALRGDVETIVRKALEKEKERRYDSAAALAADIRRFLRHEPITARPPSRLYSLGKFVRRNKAVVVATLLVFLSVVAGLVVAARYGLREAAQRRVAERQLYRADLALSQRALREGNFAVAQGLHERAPLHLRGWEWRYLDRMWSREFARVSVPDVVAAAFLDEARVLTVDRACGVRVWDAFSGVQVAEAAWPAGQTALALSADGRWLLSHGAGALTLGDPLGGEPPLVLPFAPLPKFGDRTSDVSADGARLAVTTVTDELFVVDVGRGARVLPRDRPGSRILTVTFHPDSRRLAIRSDSELRVWDTGELELLWQNSRAHGAVAFTPDGDALVGETEGDHGEGAGLVWWDAATGARLGGLARRHYSAHHFSGCREVRFSPAQELVALVFGNTEIVLLDATSVLLEERAAPVGFLEAGDDGDLRVAFGPGGRSLLSRRLGGDGLRLWSIGSASAAQVCGGHVEYVYSVAFDPDGASVASGAWDGSVRVWDAASGAPLARLALPGGGASAGSQVHGVAYSPDGRSLARLTGGRLDLLDAASGRTLATPSTLPGTAVAFSPDGAWLAANSRGRPRLWDARTLEERAWPAHEGGPVIALAFSADGSLLATGSTHGSVCLWEPSTGALLARCDRDRGTTFYPGANGLAFAPDGARLVVGWGDSSITLHDVPSLAERGLLEGHTAEVFAVAFSPDGTRVASGGRDGALRVWDAETRDLLAKLEGHSSYIKSLAFSPDGRQIATGSGDKTVRIWDSAPAAERREQARRRARARPAAERLVAELLDELGDPPAVAARVRATRELTPELRGLALRALLAREWPAQAPAPDDE